MMKKENGHATRNGPGHKNNDQNRETNTDPETIVTGQGCSFCVDMGCGIGVGCLVCQAVQVSEATVDEQNEADTGA